jgi:hypothetical protein
MRTALLALAVVVSAAATGQAHDIKPQHGGRTAEAGDYHIELVAKADVVEVHLANHDNKSIPAAGYKGLAILNIGGKSQRIVLAPGGGSILSGKAGGSIQGPPKGVVQITPPKGKTVQARFN